MLLPLWLAQNLMYATFALGLVPMVVVGGRKNHRWWVKLLAILTAGVFMLIGFRVDHLGAEAIIVKLPASGSPVEITHGRLYSAKSYTLQNGTTVRIAPSHDHYQSTIVNDTPMTLQIKSVQYATSRLLALPKSPPETIAPYSIKDDAPDIDDIGPDAPAPATMTSPIQETFRFQLTWVKPRDTPRDAAF